MCPLFGSYSIDTNNEPCKINPSCSAVFWYIIIGVAYKRKSQVTAIVFFLLNDR